MIGLLCGLASYYGVYFLKERLRIDDALDVSSARGFSFTSLTFSHHYPYTTPHPL